jgi:hypothetical protein
MPMFPPANNSVDPGEGSLIPFWVKVLYSGFLCILVPHYLQVYGPTNFLYFCDVALFLTWLSLWREEALWASMSAVGILLPQSLWMADFIGGLFGMPITGTAAYMFDARIPLVTRSLSLFHFWLPLFLLWVLKRLGYDRRAFLAWTVLAWALMLVCYFFMPPPPAPPDKPNLPVNINYVYGLSDAGPQQWMPPLAYLALLIVGMPLCIFWPTHVLLSRFFPSPELVQAGRRRRAAPNA